MKKFTKLFLSCAAIAAVTAAVATTAMAADPALNAVYDADNATGTLTLEYKDVTLAGQTTILVTTEELKATTPDSAILYVDQAEAGAFGTADATVATKRVVGLRQVPTVTVADDEEAEGYLPNGTYYVYVGYQNGDKFAILADTFSIGVTQVLVGDANQDGAITGRDATRILKHNVGDLLEGIALKAADANRDQAVTGRDATAILKYNVGNIDNTNNLVAKPAPALPDAE